MQLLFIGTGHPAVVVLMRGAAPQLISSLLSFDLRGIHASAMGLAWRAA
ncbi:hypothetical protein SynA1825c_02064 [Synechococcus sp. A18-25c]|nr:hypothetical protein SynA1560_02077 [Synechococcus sp. A15-60]QNJ20362.1 hypothetical protein SynA1825c_02064 [Synechococcus sp. A18-25c]